MKIMHISDLHFGMNQLSIIDTFLNEVAVIKPDIIIISGDVTQRATKEQFKNFATFSKKLPGVVLIVPGNHDIPLYPSQIISRFLNPYKNYKSFVSSDISASFQNDVIRILGVCSVNPYRAKKGKLSSATMEQIATYFASPFNGLNILFFHHNFDILEGAHKPLENYQELMAYIKTSSLDIVCAGHSHYANVNLIEKSNAQACVSLHAGTLLCTRSKDRLNSYFLINSEDNRVKIELRVFQGEGFYTEKNSIFDLRQPFSNLSL